VTVAYGLRGEGLVWLIGGGGMSVAAPRDQLFAVDRAMYGDIMCCGVSLAHGCQSVATAETVKRRWPESDSM